MTSTDSSPSGGSSPIAIGTRLEACCTVAGATMLESGDAEHLAQVLKALGDPIRLRLLSIIASAPTGEVCACDLPDSVERSQPTVSHHLSQLVAAGILEREQRGKWAWFRLQPTAIDRVVTAISSCCAPDSAPSTRDPA